MQSEMATPLTVVIIKLIPELVCLSTVLLIPCEPPAFSLSKGLHVIGCENT